MPTKIAVSTIRSIEIQGFCREHGVDTAEELAKGSDRKGLLTATLYQIAYPPVAGATQLVLNSNSSEPVWQENTDGDMWEDTLAYYGIEESEPQK